MQQRNGFCKKMLSGVLIGIGCILPGVSGGVMAVSFGLYRPMLDAVMGFFHAPGQHLRFLAPLATGIAIGIAVGASLLAGAMQHYESLMLFLFTGFILGGIPDLLAQAQQHERFRYRWLLSLGLGILLALPLSLLGKPGAPLESLSAAQSFLTGLLEGIGTVVPGVSTSFVLLRLGWYRAYLQTLASLNVWPLLWIAGGFIAAAAASMRGVQWLFDRHTGHAYYAVLGFVLVSIALVFPGFHPGAMLWAESGMLISGIVLARWLSRLES